MVAALLSYFSKSHATIIRGPFDFLCPRLRTGRAALACLGNLLAADRGVEQALAAGAAATLMNLAQDVRLPAW